MAVPLFDWSRTRVLRAKEGAALFPVRLRSAMGRPATIGLGVIVLAGLLLRIYFMVQWRPALVGFPDTTFTYKMLISASSTTLSEWEATRSSCT